MRKFLERWYGDRCPPWTWPATFGGVIVACLVALFIVEYVEHENCLAKGGNSTKPSGCYLVTKTRIY